MRVLVIGGAGYVGSHMVVMLAEAGHDVVVLDDLSSGRPDAVLAGELVIGALQDAPRLEALLEARRFDAVMHFASFIEVGESVRDPAKYYRNNLCNTLSLLEAMVRHGPARFIFSSTAAVYGMPGRVPIEENAPARPINPYGRSKWMVEQALGDYDAAYGLKSVSLRYFNAAGADPRARIGERHEPESHLIPLVLQAASGRRDAIQVYGRDYPTPDGTCVRDYIHVQDLCAAHLLALEALVAGAGSTAYNLGNGAGFSVQQVIDTARAVSGRAIAVREAPRRAGDPPALVASAERARRELGWRPAYPELEAMVRHAWAWELKAAAVR
ncbi:MAG TPA: UDP-glucose 4-epimerase GalE [Burkholderiales bacterium]|nr:UDP-glucose 4-epimerase GalE [Burkholderiales bacterium]